MKNHLQNKNEYILNENITYNLLINSGFIEIKTDSVDLKKFVLIKPLVLDIELHIEIFKDHNEFIFDDNNNIHVIDGAFGRHYIPFYDSEKGFDFLNKVINEYNNFMDNNINIFSKKTNKVLIKK